MNAPELQALRKKLKITLLELAATTGLPESYLAQIEAGQIPPLENDLRRMERALRDIQSNVEAAGDDTF